MKSAVYYHKTRNEKDIDNILNLEENIFMKNGKKIKVIEKIKEIVTGSKLSLAVLVISVISFCIIFFGMFVIFDDLKEIKSSIQEDIGVSVNADDKATAEVGVNIENEATAEVGVNTDDKATAEATDGYLEVETTAETTTVEEMTTNSNTNGTISKLHVSGTKLMNENGEIVVLNGISTHGIAWFPQYINKEAFRTIKDSFGGNVIRVAMYSDPVAGYTEGLHSKVDEAVNYATELGMYVIIDWHILSDGNPNTYKSQAINFFSEMSAKYKDYNNVLYEICNEPNGNVSWSNDVKPYAIELIETIRSNDPDGIILVGTTTWAQDVDIAANDPITGYSNIMYTLHFYAATHNEWNQQKLIAAINKGLPVFVSEFSICDASGNGWNDVNSGNQWIEILDRYDISFIGWNLSNKAEASAIILNSCGKTSGWTDDELSESGKWLVEQLRNH